MRIRFEKPKRVPLRIMSDGDASNLGACLDRRHASFEEPSTRELPKTSLLYYCPHLESRKSTEKKEERIGCCVVKGLGRSRHQEPVGSASTLERDGRGGAGNGCAVCGIDVETASDRGG